MASKKDHSVSRWNWNFFETTQGGEEWKEARKKILTASLFPEFFGFGFRPWKDVVFDAVEVKTGFAEYLVERGHQCEPIAIKQFCQDFKEENIMGQQTLLLARPGLLVDAKHQVGASLDRLIFFHWAGNTDWYNLEVKCPNPQFPLPSSPADIKPRILMQICVQMAVTKLDATYLYFWAPGHTVCFLAVHCVELWDFFESVIPDLKKHYFKEVPKPRNNPFKIHMAQISKILDKWREKSIVKLWEKKNTNDKSGLLLCELPSTREDRGDFGCREP